MVSNVRHGNMPMMTEDGFTPFKHFSEEQYKAIMDYQNWSCAMCKVAFSSENKKKLDHAHNEELLCRGYLCDKCNRDLGRLSHDKNIIASDIQKAYLSMCPCKALGIFVRYKPGPSYYKRR